MQAQRVEHHHQGTAGHANGGQPGWHQAGGGQRQGHHIVAQRKQQILPDHLSGAFGQLEDARQDGQIGIQKHRIRPRLGEIRGGRHSHGHIRGGEHRHIIDTIAHHHYLFPARLHFLQTLQLVLRAGPGGVSVDAEGVGQARNRARGVSAQQLEGQTAGTQGRYQCLGARAQLVLQREPDQRSPGVAQQ